MRSRKSRKQSILRVLPVILLAAAISVFSCGTKNPALTSAKIYLDLTPPDYDQATAQLLLAAERDSLNGEVHYLLGKIYAEKQWYEAMLPELQKAEKLKLKPEWRQDIQQIKAQAWIEVLNSGIEMGRRQRQAEQLRPELLTDFSKYPQYKDSLKSLSEGLEGAEKLTWDPYQMYSQAKPALEELERMLGDEAIRRYLLAIAIDSTRYEAFLNLAAEHVYRDELETALGYYQKAYQIKPDDSNVMNDYASTLLNAKKFEQALGLYETILENDPTNLNALVNVAMIYARKGEAEQALDTYSKIIAIDPEYQDAYFNRGLLLLSEAQEKIVVLKAYKDSAADNPKSNQISSRYQSAREDYNRVFVKTESDLTKTTEIDPKDRDAFFHLGLLYVSRAQVLDKGEEQNQDLSGAEEAFKKCLELDAEDTESAKYLGFVLVSESKWQEASLVLEQLVGSTPTDREAWGYLAIAYARLGEKDKAEEAFKKSAR
ncbi:MAG: tetratricopeptide repeat protein [Candidatus Zixiibacteriota bacterium]|nr:MAG: tetratricopeptide repeat protein [candidate division Zixibacteria bacterium]